MNEISLHDKCSEERVSEAALTYGTVDNDGECQSENVPMSVLYDNVRTDDDKATYTTLNLGTENCNEHVYMLLEIKQISSR